MQSISIIEPIKIRLKGYKTLFRRSLPLEKHEKAILGLIYQNNGNYGFSELGAILGFAVADYPDLHLRKDVAEIQMFQLYLEGLRSSHLIEYNNQNIDLTFWGEKSIKENLKYSFHSGDIQIPEFFDIELDFQSPEFNFKEIGVEVRLTNEQNLNKAWYLDGLEAPDTNLVNQFLLNRFNKNDEIIFDSIEPLSNLALIETNLEFSETDNLVNVLYESKLHEQLSKEINKSQNNLKAEYLKLKINCKRLIESKENFFIEDLTDFISIVDWSDVLEKPNVVWDRNSIGLLEKFQVNWSLISSLTPISIIQGAIDGYIEKFDWLELTNRLNFDFILVNIDKYPWDVDVLTERVTLDDFKNHVSKIVKLSGIDLSKFYRKVDKDFIMQNFYQLPDITNYISINESGEFLDYLLVFTDAPWNKSLVSQKLGLSEIEENFLALKQNLNYEILIERFITDSYDCNVDTFKEIISLSVFSDDYKILNRFSKCNLNLIKLQILDNHGLIYWGNEVGPGFELNSYQDWSIEIVKTFEDKWGYGESIRHLAGNISDSKILEELNFEWDFETISKNSLLLNHDYFFEENKTRIVVNSAIHLFNKNTLKLNLRSLVHLNQENKIEDLQGVISKLFSLDDIIETNTDLGDLFYGISNEIDWRQIWSKTPRSFIKDHIEEIFNLVESVPSFSSLLTEITNCIEVEEVLELPDFAWDWNNVTERAIEEEFVDVETLVAYSRYWDWKVLIEKYFDPEDLQIDGRLFEIADLISKAPIEVIEKSWKLITDIYPSHSIWRAINTTDKIDLFKWNWNSISSSNKITLDLNTLHRYKERINWSLLSSNSFLNSFFRNDREIYSTRKQWENHVFSYLSEFLELWDFNELSKLENITRSETIVHYFRQKWDWNILSSEKSKLLTIKNMEGVVFNERLFKTFENFINFEVISLRKDVFLEFEILNKFKDKNWDWKALSRNDNLKIEKEILLTELLEKPWDWKVLSNNPAIQFSNEDLLLLRDKDLDWSHFSKVEWIANSTILELADKTWDWHSISSSNQLIFDQNLLKILSLKEEVNWDNILSSKNLHCNEKTIEIIEGLIKDSQEYWSTLSANQNLSFENKNLLDKYKEFWNWDVLIRLNKIDINSNLILKKYQEYLDWPSLSANSNFIPDLDILNEFKHLLDWRQITIKITLSDELIENFKSYLDWKVLSSNFDFRGQLELVKRYINYVDINAIEENPSVDYEICIYIKKYLDQNIIAKFIYNIKNQKSEWAGFAYHFSNIDNAIKILREGKIKCRNKAEQLSDSAGNVVWSNLKPHKYSRFYFRPHTQTQFYNEFLGVDIDNGYRTKEGYWHSFYKNEYAMLDYPKCPIPIYFIFPLESVLDKSSVKISSGNMQRSSTRFGTLNEMFTRFNFNDLFIYPEYDIEDWRKYRNYAQQELLIENEFNFSGLNDFRIVCHDQKHKELLIKLLGSCCAEFLNKIYVDASLFRNENPKCNIFNQKNKLSIYTNRQADGFFEIKFRGSTEIKNLNGDITDKRGNGFRFKSNLEIEFSEESPHVDIFYYDENRQKWFVYSNHELDNNLMDTIRISNNKNKAPILNRDRIAEHLW